MAILHLLKESLTLSAYNYGGAVLNSGSLFEYNMQLKQKVHIPEKQGIAQKSLDYISEGDSIFLDAGTTVAEVAKLLQNKKILW